MNIFEFLFWWDEIPRLQSIWFELEVNADHSGRLYFKNLKNACDIPYGTICKFLVNMRSDPGVAGGEYGYILTCLIWHNSSFCYHKSSCL